MAGNRCDRAVTVFSPDDHLFLVEYAQEAVKQGSTAIGIRGKDIVVLGVEKKAVAKRQVDRTVRKICLLDDHVVMCFAGLTADARILIDRARVECHKLHVEDPITMEYIGRYVAGIIQKYTQSRGRRPFGLSVLMAGFYYDGTSHLYLSDPSGSYYEWKATAIGRNSKTVEEFLEKQYSEELAASDAQIMRLAMELVQSVRKTLKSPFSSGEKLWSARDDSVTRILAMQNQLITVNFTYLQSVYPKLRYMDLRGITRLDCSKVPVWVESDCILTTTVASFESGQNTTMFSHNSTSGQPTVQPSTDFPPFSSVYLTIQSSTLQPSTETTTVISSERGQTNAITIGFCVGGVCLLFIGVVGVFINRRKMAGSASVEGHVNADIEMAEIPVEMIDLN